MVFSDACSQAQGQDRLPGPPRSHPRLLSRARRQPRPEGVRWCLAQAGTQLAGAPVGFSRASPVQSRMCGRPESRPSLCLRPWAGGKWRREGPEGREQTERVRAEGISPRPQLRGPLLTRQDRCGRRSHCAPGRLQRSPNFFQRGGKVNTWEGRRGSDAGAKVSALREGGREGPLLPRLFPHSPFPETPARRHLPRRQLRPGRSTGPNVSRALRPAPPGARPGGQSEAGPPPLPGRTYPRPWPPPPGPPGRRSRGGW